MPAKAYATLVAVLFALMALAQLTRAIMGLPITIGQTAIPIAASWIAFAVFALLSAIGFVTKRE